MLRSLLLISILPISFSAFAQDINVQLKEAENFEKQLNKAEALNKYKLVTLQHPTHQPALVKAALLSVAIGAREKSVKQETLYYLNAEDFATKALAIDNNNADANYAMAVVARAMTEVEEEKKKLAVYIKQVKQYAEKALSINSNHAYANFVLGKWHFEVSTLSWVKKAAMKTLFCGMPAASTDSAIVYLEKCRVLDPYYVANYTALATVYKNNEKPAQAIEVLNKLIRLPNRTADDTRLKEEGEKMLNELQ